MGHTDIATYILNWPFSENYLLGNSIQLEQCPYIGNIFGLLAFFTVFILQNAVNLDPAPQLNVTVTVMLVLIKKDV